MKIDIADDTLEMMQADAKPLVDTYDTVIKRWGAFYREHGRQEPEPERKQSSKDTNYPPHSAPSLTHTRIIHAVIDGSNAGKKGLYWNAILDALIVRTADQVKSTDQLKRLILVNHVKGRKLDQGYHYIPEADVSVQGQDSDAAWKAAYHLAKFLKIGVEVHFVWAHKPGAAKPGEWGVLKIEK
jgi:hypothetical protein